MVHISCKKIVWTKLPFLASLKLWMLCFRKQPHLATNHPWLHRNFCNSYRMSSKRGIQFQKVSVTVAWDVSLKPPCESLAPRCWHHYVKFWKLWEVGPTWKKQATAAMSGGAVCHHVQLLHTVLFPVCQVVKKVLHHRSYCSVLFNQRAKPPWTNCSQSVSQNKVPL